MLSLCLPGVPTQGCSFLILRWPVLIVTSFVLYSSVGLSFPCKHKNKGCLFPHLSVLPFCLCEPKLVSIFPASTQVYCPALDPQSSMTVMSVLRGPLQLPGSWLSPSLSPQHSEMLFFFGGQRRVPSSAFPPGEQSSGLIC